MKKNITITHHVMFLVVMLLCIQLSIAQNTNNQPPVWVSGYGASVDVKIEPTDLHIGDNAEIKCYLRIPYKALSTTKAIFNIYKGAVITQGNATQIKSSLKKGDTVLFSIKVKVTTRHLHIDVAVFTHIPPDPDGREWDGIGGKTIDMITLAENDTISYEKFGNDDDLWPRIGPEYQYDIVGGFRIPPLGRVSEEAKNTRMEIEELKKQDPTMSDWDALEMLHDAFEEMVVRYDIHTKEVSIPILLRARVIMQKEGLKKWPAVDRAVEEYQNRKKEPKSQFFRNRPDNNTSTDFGFVSNKTLVDITISGTIKYKKHLARKTTGLDTLTIDMPLRYAKVYIRGNWYGHGASYFGPTSTDNNGYFSYTIGGVVDTGYFKPLVFLRRPGAGNDFDRVKVISDSLRFSYIPPPEDSNNWRYQWKVESLYQSTNIGVKYCAEHSFDGGIWPTSHQPRSGAANIFDDMISAYKFCIDSNYTTNDTIYRAVAKWEPGYKHKTESQMFAGASSDSLFISGDTTGYINSWTDEWDDWATLHEFGHHAMVKCAPPFPACTTSNHLWHKKYFGDKNLAHVEGWANFFAAAVSDSVYQINTKKGIGATTDTTYFHNIENPWDNIWANPPYSESFEGGPWCEGAVAGSLWDIYDSQNEQPYPYYPITGFTDTTSDYMMMLFRKLWNVFDDYDPPVDTILSCQTIFHFRSGWLSFGYGYPDSVYEILYHHYVADGIPQKPTGLSAAQVGNAVRLYWHKNSETDLNGYRLHRRGRQAFIIPTPPWSAWAVIAEKATPNDTTHLDQTVQHLYRYQYKVTAYDTLGNESPYSDSVEIIVDFGSNPDGFETFLTLPTVIAENQYMAITMSKDFDNCMISLYDCCGRLIRKQRVIRSHTGMARFSITDMQGRQLAGGVYFVAVNRNDKEKPIVKKFVVVR